MVIVNHGTFTNSSGGSLVDDANLALLEISHRLWAGVPMFFVISGYCIAASANRLSHKKGSVKTYFYRRLRRIFPTYWIALLSVILLVGFIDLFMIPNSMTEFGGWLRPWWYSASQWFGNVTLTETWRYHIGGSQKALFFGHAWTLCYEEQFYAVIGLVLLIAPSHLFMGTLLVTLCCSLIQICSYQYGFSISGFFFGPLWYQFAAGVLIFYTLNYGNRREYFLTYMVFILGVAWAFTGRDLLFEQQKNLYQQHLVAFGFALLLLIIHPWDKQIARWRFLAPASNWGVMCYSLYLLHLPLIKIVRGSFLATGIQIDNISPFLTMPFYGALSVVVAKLFFKNVESHFLSSTQRGKIDSQVTEKAMPQLEG